MDLRKIRKLIKLLQESQITEIEVRKGDETIRVCQAAGGPARQERPDAAPAGAPQSEAAPAETAQAAEDAPAQTVRSPMVGVFYAAPEPGAPPFVQPGQRIRRGDVLCIIEAMKIMNPLEAEEEGVVREILVEDGAPVEYGQTLFMLERA